MRGTRRRSASLVGFDDGATRGQRSGGPQTSRPRAGPPLCCPPWPLPRRSASLLRRSTTVRSRQTPRRRPGKSSPAVRTAALAVPHGRLYRRSRWNDVVATPGDTAGATRDDGCVGQGRRPRRPRTAATPRGFPPACRDRRWQHQGRTRSWRSARKSATGSVGTPASSMAATREIGQPTTSIDDGGGLWRTPRRRPTKSLREPGRRPRRHPTIATPGDARPVMGVSTSAATRRDDTSAAADHGGGDPTRSLRRVRGPGRNLEVVGGQQAEAIRAPPWRGGRQPLSTLAPAASAGGFPGRCLLATDRGRSSTAATRGPTGGAADGGRPYPWNLGRIAIPPRHAQR